jgi:hypothetical protein
VSAFFHSLTRPSPTGAPPTRAETRRNDAVLVAFAIVLVVLGWLIGRTAGSQTHTAALGDDLPTIAYPGGWLKSSPGVELAALPEAEGFAAGTAVDDAPPAAGTGESSVLFQARNPTSPSAFKAQLSAAARTVRAGEGIADARIALSLERSRSLDRYRELEVTPVAVLDDQPAVLVTYAHIADPTRDSGASGLPVVVEAQDLLFRQGNQWVVITFAADASHFEDEARGFAATLDSLAFQGPEL